MRAYQIFGSMPGERAAQVLGTLKESAPGTYNAALGAASAALKARPIFLMRLPTARQTDAIRRCLSRVSANALAEEVLATYFVEARKELLAEWLDLLGLAHEGGILEEGAPDEPAAEELRAKVEKFRAGDGSDDRTLLLHAFAAQDAVNWPTLEGLLAD